MEGCARRVLHAATVNGEATSFPRPIRIQGGCGWTQGRPMTRAQPWEFAAVGAAAGNVLHGTDIPA